jgi:hypothetical protein
VLDEDEYAGNCEGYVTTQERRLFMLQGGHCWTSTEVDALIVYEAFHKFGKSWYT